MTVELPLGCPDNDRRSGVCSDGVCADGGILVRQKATKTTMELQRGLQSNDKFFVNIESVEMDLRDDDDNER